MSVNNGRLSEDELEERATDLFRKEGKRVGVSIVEQLPDTSITHFVYRVRIEFGEGKTSTRILKVPKGNGSSDKTSTLDERQNAREFRVLSALEGLPRGAPLVPRYPMLDREAKVLLEEDVGSYTFEDRLIGLRSRGDDIHNEVETALNDLAELHALLEAKRQHLGNLRTRREFGSDIQQYARDTYEGGNMDPRDIAAIGRAFSQFHDTLLGDSNSVIHSDLAPWHVVKLDNGRNVFIDLGRVSVGPAYFDFDTLFTNPLVDPSREKREEYLKRFLEERTVRAQRLRGLDVRGLHIDPRVWGVSYLSRFFRDMRAAAKSSMIERQFPAQYYLIIGRNPLYQHYRTWHLSDAGETLRYLAQHSREFGLDRGNILDLERVLIKCIPGISEEKVPLFGGSNGRFVRPRRSYTDSKVPKVKNVVVRTE